MELVAVRLADLDVPDGAGGARMQTGVDAWGWVVSEVPPYPWSHQGGSRHSAISGGV